MLHLLHRAGNVRLGVWSRLILALVLAGVVLGTHFAPASADTRSYGSIEGKTYRSNYVEHWGYQSVWGQTRVLSGVTWHYIREELHPQYTSLGWQDAPTQVVTDYAAKVVTTFYGYHDSAARGWSWHKDWYTGDAVNTSDGY